MTTTLANEERFVEAMKDKFQPEGAIMVFDNTKDFEEFIKSRKDKIVTTIQYVNQEKYLDGIDDCLTYVVIMKQAELMASDTKVIVEEYINENKEDNIDLVTNNPKDFSRFVYFNKKKIYAIDQYKNEKNGNITSVAFMHKGDRHPEV